MLKCLTEAAPDAETGYWFFKIGFGRIFPDDRLVGGFDFFLDGDTVQYYAKVEVLNAWICSVLYSLCLLVEFLNVFYLSSLHGFVTDHKLKLCIRCGNQSELQRIYLFSYKQSFVASF